jgi:hypothetical protein
MSSALRERAVLSPNDMSGLARFARGLAGANEPVAARLVCRMAHRSPFLMGLYSVLRDVVDASSEAAVRSMCARCASFPHSSVRSWLGQLMGSPPSEIAEELGIDPANVRQNLCRARATLKRVLTRGEEDAR